MLHVGSSPFKKTKKFENELAIPTDSIFYALSSDVCS